jgi:iron complex outermembrane receptor protein
VDPPARSLGDTIVWRNAALPSNIRVPAAKAHRACLVVGLCTLLSIAWQGLAQAEDTPRPQEAQAPRVFAFDIAPQPLASALMALGRQAGLQVVVDAPAVAGLSSGGLTGTMSAERALQQVLAGSGLMYRFTNANTVAVERPGAAAPGAVQLDPVQVQGYRVPAQAMIDNLPPPYAGGQVATGGQLGLLGNRGVMDTPFNQTSYTAELIANQQARTIRDVLANDPSVSGSRS